MFYRTVLMERVAADLAYLYKMLLLLTKKGAGKIASGKAG